MLRKTLLSVMFVLLFALVQAGIVTHEIGHFQDIVSHSQQDKNTTSEHCAQCLTMAHADGAVPVSSFQSLPAATQQHWSHDHSLDYFSSHRRGYAARAPPVSIHA